MQSSSEKCFTLSILQHWCMEQARDRLTAVISGIGVGAVIRRNTYHQVVFEGGFFHDAVNCFQKNLFAGCIPVV